MFERCLYFNVNALTRTINRIWVEAFDEFNLPPSHAYLLRLAISQPGLTPKQISHELKLEKSTITRFLDNLEKKKLVFRKRGTTDDYRIQEIHPTKKSLAIAHNLENKGNELYQTMSNTIGKSELTKLVKQLRMIETQLK